MNSRVVRIRRPHCCLPIRRGTSLLEMLIVVSTYTVLLGLVVQYLHVLLRSERAGREQIAVSLRLDRIRSLWREDMHRAEQAVWVRDAEGVESLKIDWDGDQYVIWQAEPNGVLRTVKNANKTLLRDRFRLGVTCEMKVESSGERRLATLRFLSNSLSRSQVAADRHNRRRLFHEFIAVVGGTTANSQHRLRQGRVDEDAKRQPKTERTPNADQSVRPARAERQR